MANLDPWGKPLNVTESELKKLRQEIIEEGINKRAYSSAEESEGSNSDNELLMKFVPKKAKKNGKIDFDSIAYAFSLNIKLSKTRSELARIEERMRYLQLDLNNKEIKIEKLREIIFNDKECIVIEKEKLINSENNLIKTTKLIAKLNKKVKYLSFSLFISFFCNYLFNFNYIFNFLNFTKPLLPKTS